MGAKKLACGVKIQCRTARSCCDTSLLGVLVAVDSRYSCYIMAANDVGNHFQTI